MQLTARQTEMLDAIRQHIRRHGYSPTVRELQKVMGISSPNGVICHLKALRKKGKITQNGFTARSITVVEERPWYETYDNVTRLGRWLMERNASVEEPTVEQLQLYYESPWKWTAEWEEMQREQ